MKKSIIKILAGIIIIATLILLVVITNKKNNNYLRPNYDYVAVIYHSEMLGMDAGTEYIYYIYESRKNDNKYFYIKSESSITIAGSGEKRDVYSDAINKKEDLKKITKDIAKDSRKSSQTYINYTYTKDGVNVKCKDMNALGNKLFN